MNSQRYHPVSAAIHWLMFLLIATALAAIEVRGNLPKTDTLRDTLKNLHMLAGQLVLLFLLFRLAARLAFAAPRELPGARWQIASAHAVHAILYLMMLALPLSGIVLYQSGGKDVSFFGILLPHIVAADKSLHGNVHEVHEFLGNAIYFVVGLHILAAVWHHFIKRDATVLRMLPWKK